jgi:DNA-binding transcriptional LysR family regulator
LSGGWLAESLRPMSANRWLGVEFRHLAALAAVQKTGSFRCAAEDLGYVQSAVSQQIARLERLVGVRLVERTRGTAPVHLTSAGELLLEHVDGIMARFRAAQADLGTLADGLSGTVRVGVFQSTATRLLPPIVRLFRERWPKIRIVPTGGKSERDLFDLVERGDLDLSFAELPLEHGPFDVQQLFAEPCVLVVAKDSPLSNAKTPPSLTDLAGLPLIAPLGWRMFARIKHELESSGTSPEIVFESDTNSAVQALVGAGIGAAILPRLAVDLDDPATTVIDLQRMLPQRTVGLFWHRERRLSQAAHGFCRAAAEVCDELLAQDAVPVASEAALAA